MGGVIKWVFVVVFLFSYLFCLHIAQAEQGIFSLEKSGWKFYPYLTYAQTWTSNLSLNPPGQENEDYIFVGRSGIHMMNPEALREKSIIEGGRRYLFDFDGYADWVLFKNDHRKGIRPASKLAFAYFSGTGLFLKINDDFVVTEEPSDDEITGLKTRIGNSGQFLVGYDTNRWEFTTDYRNNLVKYMSFEYLDSIEQIISATGYYKFSPMLKTFVQYSFGMINYSDQTNPQSRSDSKYNQGEGGLEWRMTPKIMTTVKGGYQARDYDWSERGDFSGWVASLNLDWNILQSGTNMNFSFNRTPIESTYQTNNFYISYKLDLNFSHKFLERWLISVNGFWHYDAYPEATTEGSVTQKRVDQIWLVGANLGCYIIHGLSVGAGFSRQERNSNFEQFSYNESVINMIRISAVF